MAPEYRSALSPVRPARRATIAALLVFLAVFAGSRAASAGAVVAAQSSVTGYGTSMLADGQTPTSFVTVLRDATGAAVAGQVVLVAVTATGLGTCTGVVCPPATSDSSGNATVGCLAPASLGPAGPKCNLTVSAGGITLKTVPMTVVGVPDATKSAFSLNLPTGSQTLAPGTPVAIYPGSTIDGSLSLKDKSNNALSGIAVDLAAALPCNWRFGTTGLQNQYAGSGLTTGIPGTTVSGTLTFQLHQDNAIPGFQCAGQTTMTATLKTSNANSAATSLPSLQAYIVYPDAARSSGTASVTTIPGDGKTATTVTFILAQTSGALLPAYPVTLPVLPSGWSISGPSVTDASGKIAYTVKASVSGTATLAVVPGGTSITLTATPAFAAAKVTTAARATTIQIQGNLLSNATVKVGTSTCVVDPASSTDSLLTCTVTSTAAVASGAITVTSATGAAASAGTVSY